MKKQIFELWMEALRGNKYTFRPGRLKTGESLCPLGVLCDISKLSKWEKVTIDEEEYLSYLGQTKYLPKEVADWAGLKKKERKQMVFHVMTLYDQMKSVQTVINFLERSYSVKRGSVD